MNQLIGNTQISQEIPFFFSPCEKKKNLEEIGSFRSLNVLYVRIQILKNYVKVVRSKNSPEHFSHKGISRNGQRQAQTRTQESTPFYTEFYRYMPCPSLSPKLRNYFGLSKLFWIGTNCFGQVQIILVMFKLDFSGLIFMIWTSPK